MPKIEPGVYLVQCSHAGNYLNVRDYKFLPNQTIELNSLSEYDKKWQLFHIFPLDHNMYIIVNRQSGMPLGIEDDSTESKKDLQLKHMSGEKASTLTWLFHATGKPNVYTIVNQKSKLFVVPDSWDANEGTAVQQEPLAPPDKIDRMHWKLLEIDLHKQPTSAYENSQELGDVYRLHDFKLPSQKKTVEAFIGRVNVPFPFINDPALNCTQQSEYIGYYTITRYGFWQLIYYYEHSGKSEYKKKSSYTVGLASTNSRDVELTTGISVTAEASFGFKGFGASLSATYQSGLKVTTSSSTTESSSRTVEVERNYTVGDRVAEAIWIRADRYEIKRGYQKVLDWVVQDPNAIKEDSFPKNQK